MKFVITFCVILFAVALARPDDHYTSKYDNVDLDEILGNDKLLTAYFNCVMEKGKCTPDGNELKAHIADALETECSKCTDTQKDGTKRVIKHLINKKPEYWSELCAKYDPDKKYATKYEKELKEVQS